MEVRNRPRVASWVWSGALVLCLAIAVVLVVRALRAAGGLSSSSVEHVAVPLLIVLLVATVVALLAWRADARAAGRLMEAERRAREAADSGLDEAREEGRDEARKAREEAHAERERRLRAERARSIEREWVHELRSQVVALQRRLGTLGGGDDVRELVLRVAVELLEAEKGVLLERDDGDGDGRLDVVCSIGFEHDPGESRLAQRMADRVLRHDETLREDGEEVRGEDATPADREIDNLVAIPVYVADDFGGIVVCANREDGFEEMDDEVLLSLGDHAGTLLHHDRLRGQLRSAYLATVGVLAGALEAKDPFLRGHSDEVAGLVASVADRLGIERDRREQLVFGSLLHDVGKLGISERILLKPGRLTPEERAIVELHPRIGFQLIEQVPALRPIAPAILHHHERWDGGGYPAGLRGNDIPLEARIVAVADSFSAMTGERTYRDPLTPEEACQELVRGAGTQYDPEVVRVFVEELEQCGPTGPATSPLEDPELRQMLGDGEPLLGAGATGITDPVTLLYAHRPLLEALGAEVERARLQGRPFTVAVGELTELDEVNRTRGYAAGDRLLWQAARAFEDAAAEEAGALAGRLSGRRMAVVVPGEREELAARLGGTGETPLRVGVATWREGDTADAVLARALAGAAGGPAAATAPASDGEGGISAAAEAAQRTRRRFWRSGPA